MTCAGLFVVAGIAYALVDLRTDASASNGKTRTANAATLPATSAPITTASVTASDRTLGKSGLPLPRFVSLKANRVNVRRGPSSEHSVSWVFTARGMPVEIIAEFGHWRRIRDSEGEEGWIYHSLLTGSRTAMVAPWRKNTSIRMFSAPNTTSGQVARVHAGAIGKVKSCTGNWCRLDLSGYDGWINQTMLWGVYPGERIDAD